MGNFALLLTAILHCVVVADALEQPLLCHIHSIAQALSMLMRVIIDIAYFCFSSNQGKNLEKENVVGKAKNHALHERGVNHASVRQLTHPMKNKSVANRDKEVFLSLAAVS